MQIQYRSSGLPLGVFNKPGVIHAHIDGSSPQQILAIVKAMDAKGYGGTLDYVSAAVAGPQRRKYPEMYRDHTPIRGGQEAFDCFGSIIVPSYNEALAVVGEIREMLAGAPGSVVELEQNTAWVSSSGWHALKSEDEVVVQVRPDGLEFEVHHNFDVPKSAAAVDLQRLAEFCERNGTDFGGWFFFDDGDTWSYWSNAFSPATELREMVATDQAVINRFLNEHGLSASCHTLVERLLGLWSSS